MAMKLDVFVRFYVDYRQFKERTVEDVYSLPRIEVRLDALERASCFLTFDLRSGYYQVEK